MKQYIKLLLSALVIGVLISCGGMEPLKLPASVDAKKTGDLGRGEVIRLKTREDVTVKIKYRNAQDPVAQLILLPGHQGRLMISNQGVPQNKQGKGDFLSRNEKSFVAKGFNIALVDCPSDNCRENKGLLWGFRESEEHAIDIAHVIKLMKDKTPDLPIWLVGAGRGTESVLNVTMRLQDELSGIVLASSTTLSTEFGPEIENFELEKVTLPVMAISHEDSVCKYADPDDQEDIIDELENAKATKLVIMEGGEDLLVAFPGQACHNKSKHMFYTHDDDAVDEISKFIKSQL